MIAWGIFFAGTGAVALIHSLTSEPPGPDGELGGLIVGIIFLVMGVPVLLLVIAGVGWRRRASQAP